MVEPFVQWAPERLRLIGVALAIAGVCVLATMPLSNVGVTPRQRLVLAAALGASSYYSADQYPTLMTAITIGSVTMAVLIPLILSINVVRRTVSS